MSRLFLVRHAETLHNSVKVLRGKHSANDIISPLGEAQARACGAWFAAQNRPDPRVYASTYLRAQQTAQAIAEALGVGVNVLDGVQEMDIGDWVGRSYANLETGVDELIHPDGRFGFPGGEDHVQVATRCREAIADALAWGGTPIIVSHGLALQVMLCDLLGVDFLTAYRDGRFAHGNTGVTELLYQDEAWRVLRLAQTEYLS